MKVCVIQPEYCLDYSRSDEFFQWELNALDQCDETMDIIAMPEDTGAPFISSLNRQVAMGPVIMEASVGGIQIRGFLIMLGICSMLVPTP